MWTGPGSLLSNPSGEPAAPHHRSPARVQEVLVLSFGSCCIHLIYWEADPKLAVDLSFPSIAHPNNSLLISAQAGKDNFLLNI